MSAVAEIVREIYVPATVTWKQGPMLGNRNLRNAYRNAVTNLTSIGIPANKVGLMVSFATTKGFGGRNGLEPASAWFQVAKWQSLALQQVAGETGHRVGVVVGVGALERRRAGSGEGSCRVRLAVGALAVALRCADAARAGLRHVVEGGTAQPAARPGRSA